MIDKKAFRSLTCGLYIVGAQDGEFRAGCVVNTVLQVTASPAQLLVAINKENATAGVIERSRRFTATCLGQSAPMELVGLFGFRTSTELDKFAACEHELDASGVPYVSEHAVARFSARVVNVVDAGTHLLFIGKVEESAVLDDELPMTYAYYHRVKGGKTPPKASSYEGAGELAAVDPADLGAQAAEAQDVGRVEDGAAADAGAQAAGSAAGDSEALPAKRKGIAWRCEVCGHIEYRDELPEDFECPVCSFGPEMFTRIEVEL